MEEELLARFGGDAELLEELAELFPELPANAGGHSRLCGNGMPRPWNALRIRSRDRSGISSRKGRGKPRSGWNRSVDPANSLAPRNSRHRWRSR